MAKVTQRERFMQLREIVESSLTSTDSVDSDMVLRSELLGFIDTRIEMLDRKSNAPKSLTKEQRESIKVKQEIVRTLSSVKNGTASFIAADVGVSVQKASAMLKQLVETGIVARNATTKGTVFSIEDRV